MNSNYSLADGVNSRSTVINFVKPVSKVEGHQLNHSGMIIFLIIFQLIIDNLWPFYAATPSRAQTCCCKMYGFFTAC